MPTAPVSLCLDCAKRAVAGSKYCSDHQDDNKVAAYKREQSRVRPNDPTYHLYRCKRWLQVRLRVLSRDPLCKECGCHASTVADHIIPARQIVAQFGVNAFYELDRLQGMCASCHAAKSAGEVWQRETPCDSTRVEY